MTRTQGAHGTRLLIALALAVTLAGCGSLGFDNSNIGVGSRVGFLPDPLTPRLLSGSSSDENDPATYCGQLKEYFKHALNLEEAYRTRATQNKFWLYAAGITGLGVAAASGGLAAASAAAAGTIALLAISGGFAAATFATIDNAELANVYTVAANDVQTAIACTELKLVPPTPDCIDKLSCEKDLANCRAQLTYLSTSVVSARNTLETARTRSAAGALTRAAAARTLLDQEITKAQQAKEAADKAAAARKAKAEAATASAEAETAKAAERAGSGDSANSAAKETVASAKKQEADQKDKEAKDAQAALTAPLCPVPSTPASASTR